MEVPLNKAASLLYPRLTVLVSTEDEDGNPTAAPFSWVMPVSFDKPMAVVSIGKQNKGTLLNIRTKKEFVINVVTDEIAQQAMVCEKKIKNKFLESGLKTVKSSKIKTPGILESPIRLECRLKEIFDISVSDHFLVVGEILYADCASMKGSRPDWEAIKPLLHLSGEYFTLIQKEKIFKRFR